MEKKSYSGGGAGWAVIAFIFAILLCASIMPFIYTAWLR